MTFMHECHLHAFSSHGPRAVYASVPDGNNFRLHLPKQKLRCDRGRSAASIRKHLPQKAQKQFPSRYTVANLLCAYYSVRLNTSSLQHCVLYSYRKCRKHTGLQEIHKARRPVFKYPSQVRCCRVPVPEGSLRTRPKAGLGRLLGS